MVQRNSNFQQLTSRYLFPEVQARIRGFLKKMPSAQLVHLGIGDTTEPLTPLATQRLIKKAEELGTPEGYSGYGHEQGAVSLRTQIAAAYYSQYNISEADIFISDGSKCDVGRLQQLFGPEVTVAIQDPSYPVYVDGSLLQGVKNIIYMPCTSDNSFFPDLSQLPKVDLLYFCSPNNPTGVVATKEQLTMLVNYAKKNGTIIIFDAAYASFIQDPSLPRSIYEIPGAEEVAIELGSFSKLAGFTGVRLGWTVLPATLLYENGMRIQDDWARLTSTLFNGASNIAQAGGEAVLTSAGLEEVRGQTSSYLNNAARLKRAFEEKGYQVFGGDNAPYLWVHFPDRNSWEAFTELLETAQIVCTPGSGFGPSGESFLRFTAFAKEESIQEGIKRIAAHIPDLMR